MGKLKQRLNRIYDQKPWFRVRRRLLFITPRWETSSEEVMQVQLQQLFRDSGVENRQKAGIIPSKNPGSAIELPATK